RVVGEVSSRRLLLLTDAHDHTVIHAMMSALRTSTGTDISRLVRWSSANQTLYRYDVVRVVRPSPPRALALALPRHLRIHIPCTPPLQVSSYGVSTLEAILQLFPQLASAQDNRGVTPLHIAASEASEAYVERLLRAGASSLAIANVSWRRQIHPLC
ncbi:MAG: hypothetical protein SGPRY_014966, partial [Prymnesium sp.]